MDAIPDNLARYHRQMLLPQIGVEGQRRLGKARVLLVGCGALGTVIADQLVRAGVGHLRIADRDIVELSNLQRQVLFDEADARQDLPKAVAATRRLGRVNSSVRIDSLVVDVFAGNIEEIIDETAGVELLMDGTDNAETRYLINDVAVKHGIPWVYGACVGTEGRVAVVLPGRTPCLRCLFPDPPAAGELPTCDTAGVLGPAAAVVGSLQASAALKLLTKNYGAIATELITLDCWENRTRTISTGGGRRADCPCCSGRRFEFLETGRTGGPISLCGRQAIQVRPPLGGVDFGQAVDKLNAAGLVSQTPFLARCQLNDPYGLTLTLFHDGRAIVHGTTDAGRARSIVSRFVGS
jgi:adenylyltransferase/sulfurtransferase